MQPSAKASELGIVRMQVQNGDDVLEEVGVTSAEALI